VITVFLRGQYELPAISTTLNQVVNPAQTQTVVTADPNPGIAGAPVVLMATVTVTQSIHAHGTVNFTDNGRQHRLGDTGHEWQCDALSKHSGAPARTTSWRPTGAIPTTPPGNGSLALPVNQAATTTTVTPPRTLGSAGPGHLYDDVLA